MVIKPAPAVNLLVGSFVDPPFQFGCAAPDLRLPTELCAHPGMAFEIYNLIFRASHFNVTTETLTSNDTHDKMFDRLRQGNLDVVGSLSDPGQVDLRPTTTIINVRYAALASSVDTANYFAFASVYQPTAFLCIFSFLIMYRFYVYVSRNLTEPTKVSRSMFRFLIGFMTFVTGLFYALYRTGLLAQLLTKHTQFLFDDTSSMISAIARGQVQVSMDPEAAIIRHTASIIPHRQSVNPNDIEGRLYLRFWDAIQEHPVVVWHGGRDIEFPELIVNGTQIIIGPEQVIAYYTTRLCNVRKVTLDAFGSWPLVFYMKNDTEEDVMVRVNESIFFMQPAIDVITNRYLAYLETNRRRCTTPPAWTPLTLNQLIGQFGLLSIAWFIGALAMLAESYFTSIFDKLAHAWKRQRFIERRRNRYDSYVLY